MESKIDLVTWAGYPNNYIKDFCYKNCLCSITKKQKTCILISEIVTSIIYKTISLKSREETWFFLQRRSFLPLPSLTQNRDHRYTSHNKEKSRHTEKCLNLAESILKFWRVLCACSSVIVPPWEKSSTTSKRSKKRPI